MDLEGEEVAKAFARQGIAAFVLKYRLPSDEIMQDKQIGPLQDVQRALMIVRQRAKEFQIDTSKVGVMGFSAGGHLASTAGTHFRTSVISNPEHINLRPDFLMLIYPVITMGKYTHPGSRLQLLGKTPSAEQVNGYSNELQITADTPPAFIVQAGDDRAVPVQNSLMFYAGLLEKKIPAALHLYPAGGHGFGLHNKLVKEEWFNSGLAFLNYLKIIH
jgi:acetyl esterase/lipase